MYALHAHMTRKFINTLVFTALLLSSGAAFAQDSSQAGNDSLNAVILQGYQQRLADIEQQRIADSISKAELQLQFNSLKTTDNLKKEELQKQLDSLNKNEARRIAQKKAQIDSMRQTAKGYAVVGPLKDTLFYIYNRLGSFSAADRATAVSERIKVLAENFGYSSDSLKLAPSESTVDLVYGQTIIISLSESDALWNNSSKEALARSYRKEVNDVVIRYKKETGIITLAKEIGLAVLVLVVIGLLIVYTGRLFRWTAVRIQQQEGKLVKGIRIRNYTLFDAKREVQALLTLNTIVKWIVFALAIYITLPILFGIFPWTKNFADTLFGYILNPLKKIVLAFWHYLPNLITIAVIIFVFRYVLRGIHFLKTEIEHGNLHIPGFYQDWANPTYQIIRVLVFAFMVVVIFPYLPGSNSPVFQGVSVFLGFLFTFGSAGSLSNVIAGLILTYMRLFKLGDRVKIGEVTGDVIEKSLLVTRIRTIKNEIISIPNSTVMNSHTINYSSDAPDKGLIIHTTVTIGYDVPWRDMHGALIEAANRTSLLMKEPGPFVLQTSLDDFYVSYQINAYTREAQKQAIIYSDLHQNIQDVCNEKGIEIMSPHYRAERDGNTSTIPPDYLPKDYEAPGFNIKLNDNGQKKEG